MPGALQVPQRVYLLSYLPGRLMDRSNRLYPGIDVSTC